MKKTLLLVLALISFGAFAQTEKDSTKVTTTKYVAVGLSMSLTSNESFAYSSYPSVEVGITRNDVSYGVVFGRGSLKGFAESDDRLSNYFYEFKVSPSVSLGYVNANIILGIGGYINSGGQDPALGDTNSTFVEYGFGLSKSFGNLSYGLSYSNWDGLDYVTPSVSYSFN
jgi:hypothetical protein